MNKLTFELVHPYKNTRGLGITVDIPESTRDNWFWHVANIHDNTDLSHDDIVAMNCAWDIHETHETGKISPDHLKAIFDWTFRKVL